MSDIIMKAIVVIDKNWGIGKNGKLLTHVPGDLKFFKSKTLGNIVIMGRETLESLPGGKPLPGRTTIILTRNREYGKELVSGNEESLIDKNELIIVNSEEELLELLKKLHEEEIECTENHREIFVAGGESIYKLLLPHVDECFVTKLSDSYEADKFFPNLDKDSSFKLIDEGSQIEENGIQYYFTKYKRIAR